MNVQSSKGKNHCAILDEFLTRLRQTKHCEINRIIASFAFTHTQTCGNESEVDLGVEIKINIPKQKPIKTNGNSRMSRLDINNLPLMKATEGGGSPIDIPQKNLLTALAKPINPDAVSTLPQRHLAAVSWASLPMTAVNMP